MLPNIRGDSGYAQIITCETGEDSLNDLDHLWSEYPQIQHHTYSGQVEYTVLPSWHTYIYVFNDTFIYMKVRGPYKDKSAITFSSLHVYHLLCFPDSVIVEYDKV